MKKRYVLAALAAMTVFAGCGDNASQQKNTDNTTQESTTEDDLTAADPDEDGEELDPEAAELFRDELELALRRLKIINKEKYTPKKYKK